MTCPVERSSILHTSHFPDDDHRLLYSFIWPIRPIRMILDQHFAAERTLLEDQNGTQQACLTGSVAAWSGLRP